MIKPTTITEAVYMSIYKNSAKRIDGATKKQNKQTKLSEGVKLRAFFTKLNKCQKECYKNIAVQAIEPAIEQAIEPEPAIEQAIEPEPAIEQFIQQNEQICDVLIECDESECVLAFGSNKNQTKAQRQKFQKRNQILNEKVDRLNKMGFTAMKIKNEMFVQTKSLKFDHVEITDRQSWKKASEQLVRRINFLKKFQMSDKIKQVVGKGFQPKISISKGKKNFLLDATKDSHELASDLLNDPVYYQMIKEENKDISISMTFSTGPIGNSELMQTLRDYLIVSPDTKTRCISDCLAIIDYLRKDQHHISVFAAIKQNSEVLAKKYDLVNGGSLDDIKKISKEWSFPIYNIGDIIEEPGVVITGNHCVTVLPKTEKYIQFAEKLTEQYYAKQQKIIGNKGVKKTDISLNKVYIAYDFEWTYDREQLNNKESKYLDQFPYCASFWLFQDDCGGQDEPGYFKGSDCTEKLVLKIREYAEKYSEHDIVLYAHSGRKADYPLIEKILPKYFQKDNTDFASQMSTLSYNWNIGTQRIQFQDSLNLFPTMTLDKIAETYGCESKKLSCDHNKIFLDNWEQQWNEQNIEQYVLNDVLVLGQALLNYSKQVEKKYEMPILGCKNILSNSSLAQNIMLSKKYYNREKTPIYQIPDQYYDACKKSYHGGSNQLFFRGYYKGCMLFAIDINSSYPGQMVLFQFPIGPYKEIQFANVLFVGQYIQMGVYLIHVKDSPQTDFPVFYTQHDGVSAPSKVRNMTFWVTSVEIIYAYEQGYTQMYLLQAIVSVNVGNPFKEFIGDHYDERLKFKKLLKDAEKMMDKLVAQNADETSIKQCQDQIIQNNSLQQLTKNLVNSSYGKFGSADQRQIAELTSNEDLVLSMAQKGHLKECEKVCVNEGIQFYKVGGTCEMKNSHTNMMIASFITAYGRIQLNKIQRDINKLGFQCVYSDTDSVYFMVDKDKKWSNKQINTQMDKLAELHCDPFKIGKCKFETVQDVGDCLEEYNKNVQLGDEPLRYAFADEFVTLALKTYALRSTITGKCLLKGKGIPEFMLKNQKETSEIEDQMLARCKWNNNDEQLVFQNFIECAEKNKAFEFNLIQFMCRKQNMTDDQKTHMKDGLRIKKVIKNTYNQKLILPSGKCVPQVMNGFQSIQIVERENYFQEEYIKASSFEQLRQFLNMEDDQKWSDFKQNYNMIRNGETNQIILFRDFTAYQKFFDQVISKQEVRNFHHFNYPEKQLLQFDIDIKGDDLEIFQAMDYQISKESIESDLRELFRVPKDVKCEVIDRCRENKISYHVRFNVNISEQTVKVILENANSQNSVFFPYIDGNIYSRQLRITNIDKEFLFDPKNQSYTPTLNKKELQYLLRLEKAQKQKLVQTKISEKPTDDKKLVADDLKELGLDKCFFYKSTVEGKYKGSKTVNLQHIKGKEYDCADCKRKHTNDNCIFIQYGYDNSTKKAFKKVKCYKFLEAKKALKLKQQSK